MKLRQLKIIAKIDKLLNIVRQLTVKDKFIVLLIGSILIYVVMFILLISVVDKLGKKVVQQGGLGNTIGIFLQDIKNPEPLNKTNK